MEAVGELQSLSTIVHKRLKKVPEVRPFPAAVTHLVAACQHPDATAHDLESIIECDPALAVRVFQMANSPLYGLSSEAKTVEHAVSVLGVRQLRNVAVSIAGAGMFAQGATAAKQREELWNHSLGCATVARLLTDYVPKVAADDAFLAGILHDIGKLLLYDVVPEEYQKMVLSYHGNESIKQEQVLFGFSHEEIGLQSAQSWCLPEEIQTAIGYHHRPYAASAHIELVTLLHIANQLAKCWDVGLHWSVCTEAVNTADQPPPIDGKILAKLREQASEKLDEARRAMTG